MADRLVIDAFEGVASNTVRYPCEWCGDLGAWPDKCSETQEQSDLRCATTIVKKCNTGDHRRCLPATCAVAARWHDPVRRAGIDAARAASVAWAVVSTIENHDVSVVGTANDLGRANSVVRNGFLSRAGIEIDSCHAHLLYVVRGSDGALF